MSKTSVLQRCVALTTLGKIRRLAATIACIAILGASLFAQDRASRKPHHNANRSKQKSVSQALPRSLPNSAVPQAGGKASGSSQELARIERSGVSQVKPAADQKASAAPVHASRPSNAQERSTPMSFSYQAPQGTAKSNRAPAPTRTR